MHRVVSWACMLVLFPAGLCADDIYLKGGGKMSGASCRRRDPGGDRHRFGQIGVAMSSVDRIEKKRSPLDDYHDRAKALGGGDMNGWLDLARWRRVRGWATQAREAYQRVLAIDPENAEANAAIGKGQGRRALDDGRGELSRAWLREFEANG